MLKSSPELSVADLISTIACVVVDRPEEVSVNSISNKAGTQIQLRVGPADLHRIIGTDGRMARSLRIIVAAISSKLKSRYSLEIVECRQFKDLDENDA